MLQAMIFLFTLCLLCRLCLLCLFPSSDFGRHASATKKQTVEITEGTPGPGGTNPDPSNGFLWGRLDPRFQWLAPSYLFNRLLLALAALLVFLVLLPLLLQMFHKLLQCQGHSAVTQTYRMDQPLCAESFRKAHMPLLGPLIVAPTLFEAGATLFESGATLFFSFHPNYQSNFYFSSFHNFFWGWGTRKGGKEEGEEERGRRGGRGLRFLKTSKK